MIWSIYNTSTGRFVSSYSSNDPSNINNNLEEGHGYIEGFYDFDTQMVSDGVVVSIDSDTINSESYNKSLELLRAIREELLQQSDWTQAADSPLSDAKKAEWATYRQQLRDLPANTTDPANPTWPTPPS